MKDILDAGHRAIPARGWFSFRPDPPHRESHEKGEVLHLEVASHKEFSTHLE
jgi:hypothetical protein